MFAIDGPQLKLLGTFAGKRICVVAHRGNFGPGSGRQATVRTEPADPTFHFAALGYFDLTAEGLPAPVPVPIAGSLDGFGLDKFEMQQLVTRFTIALMDHSHRSAPGTLCPPRRMPSFLAVFRDLRHGTPKTGVRP